MPPSQSNKTPSPEAPTAAEAPHAHHDGNRRARAVAVPVMLFLSSMLMATAWLGHLRFKELHFLAALGLAWLIVLPEYALNVGAVRMGKGIYSGATMASFNLCTGVVCVVFVSIFVLDETMDARQYAGFALMIVAMLLIGSREHVDHLPILEYEGEDEDA